MKEKRAKSTAVNKLPNLCKGEGIMVPHRMWGFFPCSIKLVVDSI